MRKRLDEFFFCLVIVPIIFVLACWQLVTGDLKLPKYGWRTLAIIILAVHGLYRLIDDGWRYIHGY